MKIALDEFTEKMRKASKLTGYLVEVEAAGFLFDELKDEDRLDILYALKGLAQHGDRPSLANIMRHLNVHKSNRLVAENSARKQREKVEAEELLENDDLLPEIRAFIEKFGRPDADL